MVARILPLRSLELAIIRHKVSIMVEGDAAVKAPYLVSFPDGAAYTVILVGGVLSGGEASCDVNCASHTFALPHWGFRRTLEA